MQPVSRRANGDSVRISLAQILQEYYKTSTGASAFHKPCPDAPNPCLNLQRTSCPIGLPLAARDIETIKLSTPFVEKNGSGSIWRVDPSIVSFQNPSWGEFMDRLAKQICGSFGLDCADAGTLRCQLSQLALRAAGENFQKLKLVKSSDRLAIIVITLPCQFAGGSIRVSQGNISTVYDLGTNSSYCTNVVAWRAQPETNVEYELGTVTSGNQVILVYTLHHGLDCRAHHAELDDQDITPKISRVLQSWLKLYTVESPEKFLALLKYAYPKDALRACELRSNDAYLLQVLTTLAKQLGFKVGLCHASLCYSVKEYFQVPQDHNTESTCVGEHTMHLGPLVNPDGTLIKKRLIYSASDFGLPVRLEQLAAEWGWNAEQWDIDSRAYAVPRTAVVLWHKSQHAFLSYDGKGLDYICKRLISAHTPATPDTNTLIHLAIARAGEDPRHAWKTLCTVACERKDVMLWKRLARSLSKLELYGGISGLSGEIVITAIKVFGWRTMRPMLEDILSREISNKTKFDLLPALRDLAMVLSDAREAYDVRMWADSQICSSLHQLDHRFIPAPAVLLKAADTSIAFLRDHIVPRLLEIADVETLCDFARHLQQDTDFPSTRDKAEIMADIIKHVIAKIAFLKPSMFDPGSSFGPAHTATRYLNELRDLRCEELAHLVIREVKTLAIELLDSPQKQICIEKVMVPLLNVVGTNFGSTPAFEKLRRITIDSTLDILDAIPNFSVSKSTIMVIMNVPTVAKDGLRLLLDVVWPRLETMTLDTEALGTLVEQLKVPSDTAVDPKRAARIQNAARIASQKYLATVDLKLDSVEHIEKALLACENMGSPDTCANIIEHCVDPAYLCERHLCDVLLPVFPAIQRVGSRFGQDVSKTLKTVITAWYQEALSHIEPHISTFKIWYTLVSQWQCDCRPCKNIRRWIPLNQGDVNQAQSVTNLSITEQAHLLESIERYAKTFVTVRIVKNGTALKVEKRPGIPYLPRFSQWQANCDATKKLIQDLGMGWAALQRLLGRDLFSSISRLIDGPEATSTSALTGGLFKNALAATLRSQDGPPFKKLRIA